jgi:two-component system CheB/CheR fusion protein
MYTNQDSQHQAGSQFPVVGIGASAGGFTPLKEIIAEIPINSGMAYIIIQHLGPDNESKLPQLLASVSKIPVLEIVNDIHVAPNNVYVIPENNNVVAVDGKLKLENRRRGVNSNRTIDIFFESLAEVHQSHAIGVLLSGASFDGTMGLKKIKEFGGATIVQDPSSSEFTAMPQSAIDADAADYVLYPRAIPDKLVEIYGKYEISHAYSEEEQVPEEEFIHKITNLLFLKTGNDFRHYKQPTIRRRIARRMVVTKMENPAAYYNLLRIDNAEQQALFNDFLIPVTYFFRDVKPFEHLTEEIFPEMFKYATNNTLRIWVAGCSTGEEAYSIAMLMHEYLVATNERGMRIQIFASDLSEKSITTARSGIYNAQDVQQIGESRLNAYFTKRDGRYHVNKVIRDMCVFAVHNFVKDPPFARIDLVSCRNVMIYLDSYLQDKVLSSFHYSLKEKGFLLLGKSESATSMPHLFEPFGKNEKIYVRKFAANLYTPEVFKPTHSILKDRSLSEMTEKKGAPPVDFVRSFTDQLFAKFTPAGVVVNLNYDIVHFHGATSDFLEPSPGKPNFNLFKMAREGLSFELRNALSKLKKTGENISKDDIKIVGQPYLSSFEIVTLKNPEGFLMIVFRRKALPSESEINTLNGDQTKRIQELESALILMSEDIKRVTEEQQTAYEELQTTNEELLSSTEELQALNEELETSTEELQSNNEELMCVNDELQDRQIQLVALRNYAESIIRTLREPIIIIDKYFMVQSCNPSYYNYFLATEQETENQSLFEIGNRIWDRPELRDTLRRLNADHKNIDNLRLEIDCPVRGQRTIVANIKQIVDAKPDGLILIALEDITKEIAHTHQLESKNDQLQQYNDHLKLFINSAQRNLEAPLDKLKMTITRITTEKNEEEIKKYLSKMEVTIDGMQKRLSRLINYSDATLYEEQLRKTNLNAMLKKLLNSIQSHMMRKNVSISLQNLPDISVMPNQIRLLFENLIVYLLDNTPADKNPEITIDSIVERPVNDIIKSDNTTSYLKITLKSNGSVIPKDILKKLSEPLHSTHEKDFADDLAFALVKKVIDNHSGFLRIDAEEATDVTINIWLPITS